MRGRYCGEDDAGGGVEMGVGSGVVFDVFWGCVHPGAEEDCGGGCWGWVCGWGCWGVEFYLFGEGCEC